MSRLSAVDPLLWCFLGVIVFELVGLICLVVLSFGSRLPIVFLDGSVDCMLSLWDFLLGS